jgi:hypothetical protein
MDSCICPRVRDWEHIHTFSCFLFNVANDERWKVHYWNVHNAR